MAISETSTAQQAPVDYEKMFAAIKAMEPAKQTQLAEQIALITEKPPEVTTQVQAVIENLQAATPSPAPALTPAAEKLLAALRGEAVEVSASTQVAEAQATAKEAAAKGENVSAITQKIGADVGGAAFAQNVAQTAVQEEQQTQQRAGQNNQKAMHEETVAKVEGREPPAAEHANPFAALLADFKMPKSMLEYNQDAPVTRVADAVKQRETEPVRTA